MNKKRAIIYDAKEIVDLIKTALDKFGLDGEETTVGELIAELNDEDE